MQKRIFNAELKYIMVTSISYASLNRMENGDGDIVQRNCNNSYHFDECVDYSL